MRRQQMNENFKKEGSGLFKSVSMAFVILILHVILIIAIGLLVLFFRGFVNYMIWIFLGVSALILLATYLFYRRIKSEGRSIRDTLNSPMFNGRPVEVSFLGGVASIRVGAPSTPPALGTQNYSHPLQLEDPTTVRIRELTELSRLLEKGLITLDEFNQAKGNLFRE